MADMIRVLIAEDQKLVSSALATLLSMEEDIEVVAEAGDGQTAIESAMKTLPDIALVDIEMPRRSGLEVTAELTARVPTCKVLILTTFARSGYLKRAIQAGAKGYLLKDAEVSELAAAIRTVQSGGRVMDSNLLLASWEEENPLTPREVDLLRLADTLGTTRELASRVHLSEGTVRNYLSDILSKLGVQTRQEAIRMAQEKGWL